MNHDLKRLVLGFLGLIFAGAGIIAGLASVKFGIDSKQILYTIAGILDIPVTIYASCAFYKKHLSYK